MHRRNVHDNLDDLISSFGPDLWLVERFDRDPGNGSLDFYAAFIDAGKYSAAASGRDMCKCCVKFLVANFLARVGRRSEQLCSNRN